MNLGCSITHTSPFAPPEAQGVAPHAATPALPYRTTNPSSQEEFRSVSFRSLAPGRPRVASPPQTRRRQLPQRAASCAVPRVQPLQAAVPRAASAGAAVMPAMPAVATLPPLAAAPDSALAWVAGFSRLAKALGCAAPSGGLWDPPEATDLLGLLTLELR